MAIMPGVLPGMFKGCLKESLFAVSYQWLPPPNGIFIVRA
jgi:hypothetical protein